MNAHVQKAHPDSFEEYKTKFPNHFGSTRKKLAESKAISRESFTNGIDDYRLQIQDGSKS